MKGDHLTAATLIFMFVFIAPSTSIEAKRLHYQESDTKEEQLGLPQELVPLRDCISKCKPEDKKCSEKCAETELLSDPNRLQTLLQSGLEMVQVTLCTLGCALAQVCEEVDKIGDHL